MEYEKKGKIKTMLDKVNKKPKKVVMKKETPKPKPAEKSKVKTIMKATETKSSMRQGITNRTLNDMIKQNINKILPKGSSKAFEAKVKKAYMKKFDTYKIKKGKTEAEYLMNAGKIAIQTRNFIEKQIKNGEI